MSLGRVAVLSVCAAGMAVAQTPAEPLPSLDTVIVDDAPVVPYVEPAAPIVPDDPSRLKAVESELWRASFERRTLPRGDWPRFDYHYLIGRPLYLATLEPSVSSAEERDAAYESRYGALRDVGEVIDANPDLSGNALYAKVVEAVPVQELDIEVVNIAKYMVITRLGGKLAAERRAFLDRELDACLLRSRDWEEDVRQKRCRSRIVLNSLRDAG